MATSKNIPISLKFDAGRGERTSSYAKINLLTIPSKKITSQLLELEGTWSEILAQAAKFADRQFRVIVLAGEPHNPPLLYRNDLTTENAENTEEEKREMNNSDE